MKKIVFAIAIPVIVIGIISYLNGEKEYAKGYNKAYTETTRALTARDKATAEYAAVALFAAAAVAEVASAHSAADARQIRERNYGRVEQEYIRGASGRQDQVNRILLRQYFDNCVPDPFQR